VIFLILFIYLPIYKYFKTHTRKQIYQQYTNKYISTKMIRYSCPCSNVTIEALEANTADDTDNQYFEKVQNFFDTNENTKNIKEVFVDFLNNESYLKTNILKSKIEFDSADSHLIAVSVSFKHD